MGIGSREYHSFNPVFDLSQIFDSPGYPVDVANLVLFLSLRGGRVSNKGNHQHREQYLKEALTNILTF